MKSLEEEETKKIAVDVAAVQRRRALACCAAFGFTTKNTPGVDDIKPRALGMKGHTVDFDALQASEPSNSAQPNGCHKPTAGRSKRIDLSTVPKDDGSYVTPRQGSDSGLPEDFMKLDTDDGQDFEALSYNHRTRRKLRRAVEAAQIRKELLVRNHVRSICKSKGVDPPPELATVARPLHKRGQRIQENGMLETGKAERVRLRLELAEFNKAARVLRKQAKEIALESGLRVYAEMTGRIPPRGQDGNEASISRYGAGWLVPSPPDPKDFLRPEDITLST